VICKRDDGIRSMSIETVIANYLLYNARHVPGLIMGNNEALGRMFHKITIALNKLLLN